MWIPHAPSDTILSTCPIAGQRQPNSYLVGAADSTRKQETTQSRLITTSPPATAISGLYNGQSPKSHTYQNASHQGQQEDITQNAGPNETQPRLQKKMGIDPSIRSTIHSRARQTSQARRPLARKLNTIIRTHLQYCPPQNAQVPLRAHMAYRDLGNPGRVVGVCECQCPKPSVRAKLCRKERISKRLLSHGKRLKGIVLDTNVREERDMNNVQGV